MFLFTFILLLWMTICVCNVALWLKSVGYNFGDSHLMLKRGSTDHVSPYSFYVTRVIGLRVNDIMPETKEETLQNRLPKQNSDTCPKYCSTLNLPSQAHGNVKMLLQVIKCEDMWCWNCFRLFENRKFRGKLFTVSEECSGEYRRAHTPARTKTKV